MVYKVIWGISSFGRASALQAEGSRFDPVILHQNAQEKYLYVFKLCFLDTFRFMDIN